MTEVLNRPRLTVYQPIVDLRTGALVAVEALTRGADDPSNPAVLFADAARAGCLEALDEACLQAALEGVGHAATPVTLFVNVEPTTLSALGSGRLAALARRVSERIQVVLEVTERDLLDRPAELVRTVDQARDLGWGIALDDVGAEPAALALLPFLAPHVIKLDLALVQGRSTPQAAAVVNAVGAEAERSGARVLAEGIETQQHLDRALALGATLGQGWLFGRPAPLGHITMDALVLPALPAAGHPSARDPGVTPFDVLSAATLPRRTTVQLVSSMSRQLEHQAVLLDEKAVVLASCQHARLMSDATLRRYASLSSVTSLTALLGPGMADEPAPGVRGTALDPDDPLADLWVVTVIAPHFAAALVARDATPAAADAREPGQGAPPGATDSCSQAPAPARVLEYVLTYDRTRAVQVAHLLLQRLQTPAGHGTRWVWPPQQVEVTTPERPELSRLLERAVAAATNSIVIADASLPDLPLIHVNDAFVALTGYSRAEALGQNCRFLQGPDTDRTQVELLKRQLRGGRPFSTVLRNVRRDGTSFWNELHISPVRDPAGRITHYIGDQHDVTERVEREQHVTYRAYHDELTGLPNRAQVLDHLDLELRRARRSGAGVAALFFDVDGFKAINDRFGHAAGDAVLRAAAHRLRRAVRSGDLLGRLGGDEFLMVLAGLHHQTGPQAADGVEAGALRGHQDIDAVTRHLRESLDEPLQVAGTAVRLQISVGSALYPRDGLDGHSLIVHADRRMYQDKSRTGR